MKIQWELSWHPETRFEDGIAKTVRWCLDNRDWWQRILDGKYRNYYKRIYGNRRTAHEGVGDMGGRPVGV